MPGNDKDRVATDASVEILRFSLNLGLLVATAVELGMDEKEFVREAASSYNRFSVAIKEQAEVLEKEASASTEEVSNTASSGAEKDEDSCAG